jgi:uncharacterized protein (DUF433 family)
MHRGRSRRIPAVREGRASGRFRRDLPRAPVRTLTDYIEAGDSIDVFLDDFPTVSRAQVIAFIEQARNRVIAAAE